MSNLRTLLTILLLLPVAGRAVEPPLAGTFAACAGRYAAEMEHAWLMQSDAADEMAQRRQQFVDILAAVVLPDRKRQALHMRIDAKVAHAQLLSQATFSQDPVRANWALRRAKAQVAECARFLLES